MDIQMKFDPERQTGDFVQLGGDLAIDRDLETAILVSLFTDRRQYAARMPVTGFRTAAQTCAAVGWMRSRTNPWGRVCGCCAGKRSFRKRWPG